MLKKILLGAFILRISGRYSPGTSNTAGWNSRALTSSCHYPPSQSVPARPRGRRATPQSNSFRSTQIVLRGVEIVSGGRVLTGDVEIVPEGKGLTLHKVTLVADKTTVNVTG